MKKLHYDQQIASKIVMSREAFADRNHAVWLKGHEQKRLGQAVGISLQTDGYHLTTIASPKVAMVEEGDE